MLFPSGRRWSLIKRLAEAAVNKLDDVERASSYDFSVIRKMPMQLDGEIMELPRNSRVTVQSQRKLLRTIV